MLEESYQEKLEKTLSVLDKKLRSKVTMNMMKGKTKVMVVSKYGNWTQQRKVGGEKMKEINEFKYLDIMIK